MLYYVLIQLRIKTQKHNGFVSAGVKYVTEFGKKSPQVTVWHVLHNIVKCSISYCQSNWKVITDHYSKSYQHQKVISSTVADAYQKYQVWSTSIYAFVSYLANRPTHRHTDTHMWSQLPSPLLRRNSRVNSCSRICECISRHKTKYIKV